MGSMRRTTWMAGTSPAMTPSGPPAGLPYPIPRLTIPNALREPTIGCRKSESELSSPNEQSSLPPGQNRGYRSAASELQGAKGTGIFSSHKIPRNPLISLVSNEKIQGNPRKSNLLNSGVFIAKRTRTKKNQIDRMGICPPQEATPVGMFAFTCTYTGPSGRR